MKSYILLSLIISTALSSVASAGLKIYYIRHAEGGHNVKKAWEEKGTPKSEWPAYVGNSDMFTPKGLKEVNLATEKLQKHQFDFVATSPMWRARNTILPYLKASHKKAEVWPELREGFGMQVILSKNIPEVKETILNKGEAIEIPKSEQDFFKTREAAENNYARYPRDSSNEVKAGYMKHVSEHAIELIEKRFGKSEKSTLDKSILLAGHNSAGVSLLKLLLKEEPGGEAKRGITNVALWMVEQQEDGSFKLMIYNDKPYPSQN